MYIYIQLHRPSNKGTKLLLKVIKAIIIIIYTYIAHETVLNKQN